jgi:hypothetical protein
VTARSREQRKQWLDRQPIFWRCDWAVDDENESDPHDNQNERRNRTWLPQQRESADELQKPEYKDSDNAD